MGVPTMNIATVRVAASVPGRLRIKLPEMDLRRSEGSIRALLQSIEGITDVRLSKIARSIVIRYEPRRIRGEEILRRMQRAVSGFVPLGADGASPLQNRWTNWKWVLGLALALIGLLFVVMPGVPGWPLLFPGLALLEAA